MGCLCVDGGMRRLENGRCEKHVAAPRRRRVLQRWRGCRGRELGSAHGFRDTAATQDVVAAGMLQGLLAAVRRLHCLLLLLLLATRGRRRTASVDATAAATVVVIVVELGELVLDVREERVDVAVGVDADALHPLQGRLPAAAQPAAVRLGVLVFLDDGRWHAGDDALRG